MLNLVTILRELKSRFTNISSASNFFDITIRISDLGGTNI